MKIDTYRVKQYNSTSKTVVCIDGKPICIVQGCGKTLSNIINIMNNTSPYEVESEIENALENFKEYVEAE